MEIPAITLKLLSCVLQSHSNHMSISHRLAVIGSFEIFPHLLYHSTKYSGSPQAHTHPYTSAFFSKIESFLPWVREKAPSSRLIEYFLRLCCSQTTYLLVSMPNHTHTHTHTHTHSLSVTRAVPLSIHLFLSFLLQFQNILSSH